jgi:hypothetical protein
MTSTTEQYTNSLGILTEAYAEEFTDYSGTMSYFDDLRQTEVSNAISQGLSYMPSYETGQSEGNFFD